MEILSQSRDPGNANVETRNNFDLNEPIPVKSRWTTRKEESRSPSKNIDSWC